MIEEPYSNREIREFMSEIRGQLSRIEAQTIKTNGRVSKLEIWRGYTAGAVAIIVLIGVPILGYLSYKVVDLLTILNK